MTSGTTERSRDFSHPEEDEAFRDLDRRLNGLCAFGIAATAAHLAVTLEEDEAFAVLERTLKAAAPAQFKP